MNNYDVFMCYRTEGIMLAANIYSDLCNYSKNKFRIFYAPKCIKHGENFMDICKNVAGKVSLMMLILTKDFFENCKNEDDVVYQELLAALSNPNCAFLPIITNGFNFDTNTLGDLFSDQEIDRIKHINAIKYTDEYSFNSVELLLPILKEKIGLNDYNDDIYERLLYKHNKIRKRVRIFEDGKKGFFSQANIKETNRLDIQQNLMYNFEKPIYEKYLNGKSDLNVLDIGCGNGKALMERLGDREEVSKIIGVEYESSFVERAKSDYYDSKAKFFEIDVESDEFENNLQNLMRQENIEKFDWINILAVMSHLKSPFILLKRLRKFCSKGAIVFIRNIDDGLNFVYPDDDLCFQRAFEMMAKCDTTGYRYSGRELFTLLSRAGYKDIVYEKMGINSATMDYVEKEELFDTVFGFLKNGIEVTAANKPENEEIQIENKWLVENYYKLEERFLSFDSLVNIGIVVVVAHT